MSPIRILMLALAAFAAYYLIVFWRMVSRAKAEHDDLKPSSITMVTSFFANFLDTLGIGSFATTTAALRAAHQTPDEKLPGTLNVGYVLPTMLEAALLTGAIKIDPTTLILMIIAAVLGAWLGAGIVSRWPRRRIQMGMGLALIVLGGLMLQKAIQVTCGSPNGSLAQSLCSVVGGGGSAAGAGNAMALTGTRLVIGIAGNFVLGVLMTVGVGLYGPCMILISLLGMNPLAAFPIMMGSCAFLMPIASDRFVRERGVHVKTVVGLAFAGLPGVWIAAKWLTNLPINAVRWLVVVVVAYTAITLLLAARRERNATIAEGAVAAEAGAM